MLSAPSRPRPRPRPRPLPVMQKREGTEEELSRAYSSPDGISVSASPIHRAALKGQGDYLFMLVASGGQWQGCQVGYFLDFFCWGRGEEGKER